MTGFVDLFTRLIEEEGLDRSFVHGRGSPEIEGARQNQIAAFSPVSNLRGSLLPESIRHILHTTRSREAVRFRVSSHIDERRRAQRRIPGTQRGIITVQFRRLAAGPNSHDGKAASKVVLPPIYLLILAPAAQPPPPPPPPPPPSPHPPRPPPAFTLTSEGPPPSLPPVRPGRLTPLLTLPYSHPRELQSLKLTSVPKGRHRLEKSIRQDGTPLNENCKALPGRVSGQ